MARRILLLLCLLAGCTELPEYDDPRDFTGEYSGACTGLPVRCENRATTLCAGGCEEVVVCQPEERQRCLAHRDQGVCTADAACWWTGVWCEELTGGCALNDNPTACQQDSDACRWAPDCTGWADNCNDSRTPEACAANVGCEWEDDTVATR